MTRYRLAERLTRSRKSGISELFKWAGRPGVISMAGGAPAAELFDVGGVGSAFIRALHEAPAQSLQYGPPEGQQRLEAAVAEHLRGEGVSLEGQRILITTGSQQALDLVARSFVDAGDAIVVESPTFLGALGIFALNEPRYVTLPVDADGAQVERLAELSPDRLPKLVYVAPNFGNPSGACLSLERRRWLLRWASENEVFILEDDPYGALRTDGAPIPSLKALARDIPGAPQWCAYTSTLSKTVAPGLRIGWLVLPAEIAADLTRVKQTMDMHTSSLVQEAAARYLESGVLPAHVERIRKAYKQRKDALVDAVRSTLGDRLSFVVPDGGMFLWARFHDEQEIDTQKLLRHAAEEGVVYMPGVYFYASEPDASTLRLNFTRGAPEELREGVARLSRAVAHFQATQRAAPAIA
ncbi:MAG: aspartate aminotransferase [Methylocystaceae bacterium]|nr:MAG: aspartate aminotransferase [Methylocystaceae bacterium]